MTGLIVLDYPGSSSSLLLASLVEQGATPISARPRAFEAFVTLTAVLKKSAQLSEQHLVVLHGYELLKVRLGIFHRMAERVYGKHAAAYLDAPASTGDVFSLLERQRSSQYPPALLHANRNICGHVGQASRVLVGEQINPVYQHFKHWPFHANTGCTVYLAQCLEKLHVAELDCVWTNIHAEDEHVLGLRQFNPQLKFVAMGNTASRGLEKLDIPHVKIFHPQFAKRFHYHDDTYLNQLRLACQ